MEALGISMSSVIQEAKQFQDMLNSNSKECQRSIVEYRKQIGILEAKRTWSNTLTRSISYGIYLMLLHMSRYSTDQRSFPLWTNTRKYSEVIFSDTV